MQTPSMSICPYEEPTDENRIAVKIAWAHGLSFRAAELLMMIDVDAEFEVADLDIDGREWLLWLVHRGLVKLEDSMGQLWMRVSDRGRRVVADARQKAA